MSKPGFILVHRSLEDNHAIKRDPIRLAVWIELMLSANWKESMMLWDGTIHTIRRGQFVSSMEQIALRCGINRKTVSKHLTDLKTLGCIDFEIKINYGTLITLHNYDQYQALQISHSDNHQFDYQAVTTSHPDSRRNVGVSQTDTELDNDVDSDTASDTASEVAPALPRPKEVKAAKAVKKECSIAADASLRTSLDLVYKDFYPRKEGKAKGMKTLTIGENKIPTPLVLEQFEKAVKKYASHCAKTGQYIKIFSTFAHEWSDWLDEDSGNGAIPSAMGAAKAPEVYEG